MGKAVIEGAAARVPYRLHQRDVDEAVVGTIVLAQASDDEWKITGLDSRQPEEEVPSEGGPPPSSASGGLWLGGILAGVVVTAGASALVEWATRSARRAVATA